MNVRLSVNFPLLLLGLLAACSGPGDPANARTGGGKWPDEVNAGASRANPVKPFAETTVATLDYPWAIAFLPDGRMLVTEKPGGLWLVTRAGAKTAITGVPRVEYEGQGGLLDVAVSPHFAEGHAIYLTYAEPGPGGSGLALAKATLAADRLDGLKVIWRQLPRGHGGQFGAIVAFAPDGNSLFLSSGERQRFTPAQDPNQALGKILHLTLDGAPAPGNPMAGKIGAATVAVADPPADTVAAARTKGRAEAMPAPNLTPAETWTTGHRNPYGLAFDAAGKLWDIEMGPMGGDELNLIEPGKNYGWPLVSNGDNYDGKPIPRHDTRPDFAKPALYWTPVIAPAGLAFHDGKLFPEWKGSAFTGGLATQALIRIKFDGQGHAREAERWAMGHRIRDVVEGPDGALWLIEDESPGRLIRLTPKG